VWIGAARRIGLSIVRTPDAYASTDGRGTLAIGDDKTLDADDSLAQMIFHELCHSLVEGEGSFGRADWGMDNTGPDHDWREHACLRVQHVLTGRHGLRTLFAPTTEFRAFWDQLSDDVLSDRTDRSTQAAIAALRRVSHPPWSPALTEALVATARIAREAAPFATERDGDVLWRGVGEAPGLHPTGLYAGTRGSCGTCVWRYDVRGRARCRQADGHIAAAGAAHAAIDAGGKGTRGAAGASKAIDVSWPGCEHFEAAADVDCQTCGACCREAYHAVDVQPRDPAVKAQPTYIVPRASTTEKLYEIRRNGDRCAALEGGQFEGDRATKFRCVIYDDRPRTCREFTLGSEHCLTARRRVGLSL
jgi:Fe-S-cluster containining protein